MLRSLLTTGAEVQTTFVRKTVNAHIELGLTTSLSVLGPAIRTG